MKFIFKFYILTILTLCFSLKVFAQTTNISGVINNYASVTSVGSQSVSVPSATGFIVGDKILLIQMKGASIDTTNTSNFGTILSYNDAGNYEMLEISAISSTTITFTTPILRTYTILGLVQLVKIPVYNNVNVTGLLTCLPWNGLTGGVLAFEANGNITLNGNIDVTGKGFLGGLKIAGQFLSCIGNTTDFKLPSSSLFSANKGEGITNIKSSFAKGLGALANGGGAGNDVNGGGAGGGNFGIGGHGGNTKCSTSPVTLCGGYEGKNCVYSNLNNKIFLGGGGGAGHENDGVSTGGVSGGGIILIRCAGVIGNNNFINANGSNNTIIAGNDGQGGGGAGGTVLIDACSTSSLNISVKGGYGGVDNFSGPDCHGKGGGGGGGIIWTSTSLTYSSFLSGGNPGVFTNSASQCFNTSNGATVGQTGGVLTGLLVPGSVPLSSAGSFSLTISSNCIGNNNASVFGTITSTITSPSISYTWTNSSGVIISQTNNSISLVDSINNIANGIYTLSVQLNAPCGPISSQTVNINCIINPTVSCSGILTGTGMSICSQFSFSISPTQTITPLNYGSQGYACTGATLPDVSFNIMGGGWRVMKNNWFYSATTNGQISGYNNLGVIQTIPYLASNTITPLSYAGSFVQFAINGVSVGQPLNQTTFSISLTPDIFGANSYSYCANTSTSIAISPTIPLVGGPWTYNWQPGNLNGNPVNVSPTVNTIYTVTANSIGGCASTATVAVIINCCNTTLTLSPNVSLCQGVSSSVTLTAIGASSYSWTNSSSLSSSTGSVVIASPSITTNYTVTGVTSSCSNTAIVTVSVNPSPTITATFVNNTSCGLTNGSATVISSPSNNTYIWGSGVLSTTNTASSLSAGNYTVNVINGACQTYTVINILNSIPLSIISSTITPTNCNVNNGTKSVTDKLYSSSYSWTPSIATTNVANNLSSGNYSLTITNGACNTFTVFSVGSIGGPTAFNVVTNNVICQNNIGSVHIINVINGVSPYQYNFNNLGFSSVTTYTNLSQGTYTLIVKDANGCLFTQTLTIGKTTVNSVIDLTTNSPNCLENDGSFVINTITGGTSPYLTSFNNTVYTTNMAFEELSSGSYTLNVKDSNNCETGFVLIMPENNGDYTLYIPNTFTPNNDKVNDIWNVQGTCLGEFNCLIYNRWGEKIIELKDIKEGWDGTYKGASVPDGVYVYLIEVNTKSGTVNKTGHITLFR